MRKTVPQQLAIVPGKVDHEHGDELAQMSRLLDAIPHTVERVQADLSYGVDPGKGREGMRAEQVLRAVLIKQLGGFSYEQLAFHLADSCSYRRFCRIGYDQRAPSSTTLQRNVSRIRAETLEAVNQQLMLLARKLKKEDGRQVRTDCTLSRVPIQPSVQMCLWVAQHRGPVADIAEHLVAIDGTVVHGHAQG